MTLDSMAPEGLALNPELNPKKQAVLPQVELQQRLQEFKEKRGTAFHLTSLGYFGSYARGEANPSSDIDVIFDTTQPNLLTTAEMKQELEQWLNRPVDLIRLHPYLHPEFKARIEREIIYV